MRNFLLRLKGIFRKPPAKETEARVALAMMAMTHEHELSCDEVFALLDLFAEMQQRGENPKEMLPLVQRHLDMCPECKDEYDALLIALQIA